MAQRTPGLLVQNSSTENLAMSSTAVVAQQVSSAQRVRCELREPKFRRQFNISVGFQSHSHMEGWTLQLWRTLEYSSSATTQKFAATRATSLRCASARDFSRICPCSSRSSSGSGVGSHRCSIFRFLTVSASHWCRSRPGRSVPARRDHSSHESGADEVRAGQRTAQPDSVGITRTAR